jgi:acetolactate synthase I/II/III large subunit
LLMNIQEMATLAELNLNIKIIIMNNSSLGMVRQQQNLFYNNHLSASMYHRRFDFAAIAMAFGIQAFNDSIYDADMTMVNQWLNHQGPAVLDLHLDSEEMVTPMMTPGKSIHAMMDCLKEVTPVN